MIARNSEWPNLYPDLSIAMPCLDEEDTIAICIARAEKGAAEISLVHEIIVADNGSNDQSVFIAERMGARIIHESRKGYGSALKAGLAAARGEFIIMGDADESYDFTEIPKFVERLLDGNQLVMGCRFASGGGHIMPGAMPLLHQYLGNPFFSYLGRRLHQLPFRDVYCGLRGFTRDLYDRILPQADGMEFAIEMLIRAQRVGAVCAEVPITLHPDGRRKHGAHLQTFRDGWKTLKFLLDVPEVVADVSQAECDQNDNVPSPLLSTQSRSNQHPVKKLST